MGYANPVVHMGYAAFADAASAAGVDALLTVDIPPESGASQYRASAVGMDNIFLVAPTTPDARIRRITATASGFIYYVSLKGVTGAGHLDVADVAHHLGRFGRIRSFPVAVGFGIKGMQPRPPLSPRWPMASWWQRPGECHGQSDRSRRRSRSGDGRRDRIGGEIRQDRRRSFLVAPARL